MVCRNAILESALDDKTSRISALESLHNEYSLNLSVRLSPRSLISDHGSTSSQIQKLSHLLRDQEVQLLSAKNTAAIHEKNERQLEDS
jgi:hypothetical protein